MSEATLIRRDTRGPVLVATIDRPASLNALDAAVLEELADLVGDFDRDHEHRVLVITGAGKAFVAGADISEMQAMTVPEARAFSEQGTELCSVLASMDKLVVAAVNGYALGGGCELALACDLVYASPKARFGQPEVKLGVIPGFGGTQRLARVVGPRRALELLVTGRTLDAEEAASLGLVNAVLPHEGFLDHVLERLQPALAAGPLAVGAAKLAMARGMDLPLERALLLETEIFAGLFATADQQEGMKAFLEKRAAEFEGR